MGKGGGCVPSKKAAPTSEEKAGPPAASSAAAAPPAAAAAAASTPAPAPAAAPPAPAPAPAAEAKKEAPTPAAAAPAHNDAAPHADESVVEPSPPATDINSKMPKSYEPEPANDVHKPADPVAETMEEPTPAVNAPAPAEAVIEGTTRAAPEAPAIKVFIVYYSMYGHVGKLASKVKAGVDSVPGAEGILYQVPETLPEATLAKMGAPEKPADVPYIGPKELPTADAIIFGFPTRFGMMCAQMKAFFDATGSLWQSQALAGKPAGFFFSTGTQGGGQETTALTAISQLCHHGMMFVPVGYTYPAIFSMDVHGGSPYGAGTYAGDGTRVPLDLELGLAEHQGKLIAAFTSKLKKGSL